MFPYKTLDAFAHKKATQGHANGTIRYCARFVDAQGGQETLGAYPLNVNL
jgi:hypothetical protein